MIRTQIYLPHGQINSLRQKAFEENTSVSEIIRRIVENCEPSSKKQGGRSAMTALLALAELGKKHKVKAPNDLASNLDKYLYGQ